MGDESCISGISYIYTLTYHTIPYCTITSHRRIQHIHFFIPYVSVGSSFSATGAKKTDCSQDPIVYAASYQSKAFEVFEVFEVLRGWGLGMGYITIYNQQKSADNSSTKLRSTYVCQCMIHIICIYIYIHMYDTYTFVARQIKYCNTTF